MKYLYMLLIRLFGGDGGGDRPLVSDADDGVTQWFRWPKHRGGGGVCGQIFYDDGDDVFFHLFQYYLYGDGGRHLLPW